MRLSIGLLALLTGCAYVTEAEFLAALDRDGDGWLNLGTDSAGEPIEGSDCNDEDPFFYPGAIDIRGDGCDSDCGAELDSDGDDWPDSIDCDPYDATVFPCSPFEVDGDNVDSDCDGRDGVRWTDCPTEDPSPQVWDVESESFVAATEAQIEASTAHLASLPECDGPGGKARGTPPQGGYRRY